MAKFTETEQRLIHMMSDGHLHSRDELVQCLHDDMSYGGLRVHICRLRKKINPIGEDVVSRSIDGMTYYYHVRLVPVV